MIIPANSFKSCKNLKELERNFIHKNFYIYCFTFKNLDLWILEKQLSL